MVVVKLAALDQHLQYLESIVGRSNRHTQIFNNISERQAQRSLMYGRLYRHYIQGVPMPMQMAVYYVAYNVATSSYGNFISIKIVYKSLQFLLKS